MIFQILSHDHHYLEVLSCQDVGIFQNINMTCIGIASNCDQDCEADKISFTKYPHSGAHETYSEKQLMKKINELNIGYVGNLIKKYEEIIHIEMDKFMTNFRALLIKQLQKMICKGVLFISDDAEDKHIACLRKISDFQFAGISCHSMWQILNFCNAEFKTADLERKAEYFIIKINQLLKTLNKSVNQLSKISDMKLQVSTDISDKNKDSSRDKLSVSDKPMEKIQIGMKSELSQYSQIQMKQDEDDSSIQLHFYDHQKSPTLKQKQVVSNKISQKSKKQQEQSKQISDIGSSNFSSVIDEKQSEISKSEVREQERGEQSISYKKKNKQQEQRRQKMEKWPIRQKKQFRQEKQEQNEEEEILEKQVKQKRQKRQKRQQKQVRNYGRQRIGRQTDRGHSRAYIQPNEGKIFLKVCELQEKQFKEDKDRRFNLRLKVVQQIIFRLFEIQQSNNGKPKQIKKCKYLAGDDTGIVICFSNYIAEIRKDQYITLNDCILTYYNESYEVSSFKCTKYSPEKQFNVDSKICISKIQSLKPLSYLSQHNDRCWPSIKGLSCLDYRTCKRIQLIATVSQIMLDEDESYQCNIYDGTGKVHARINKKNCPKLQEGKTYYFRRLFITIQDFGEEKVLTINSYEPKQDEDGYPPIEFPGMKYDQYLKDQAEYVRPKKKNENKSQNKSYKKSQKKLDRIQ